MRVLVLGGTSEASALARMLAGRADIAATVSLAGRTANPAPLPLPVRIGGFGGAQGLATHLADHRIDLLVDATHPFAERISANAVEAARIAGVRLVVLARPPWTPVPGDRWTEVATLADAAAALGEEPRRVFLTVGRLGLAAFEAAPMHHYVIRSIDEPGPLALPSVEVVRDRPPFDAASERALMRRADIDVLVTKNAGSAATYGKVEAARDLGLPVVMVRPPPRPDVETVTDPGAVLAILGG